MALLQARGFPNVSEVGCLAHARRKFFDLHAANKSHLAQFALEQFAKIYQVEQQIKELDADDRREVRQQQSKPVLEALHDWMSLQRQKLPDSSATARALNYSLRRWPALTRFLDDGRLPVDNNWVENQIRPIAIGRNNWLFAGSLRGSTSRCNHEPHPIGTDEWPRSVFLPQRCASATAGAPR